MAFRSSSSTGPAEQMGSVWICPKLTLAEKVASQIVVFLENVHQFVIFSLQSVHFNRFAPFLDNDYFEITGPNLLK